MKNFSIALVLASLTIVAPVFACPDMDHDEAPKTVEKDKAKETAPAKTDKKDAPKPDTAKAKDAPKKDAPKPGDKVSVK